MICKKIKDISIKKLLMVIDMVQHGQDIEITEENFMESYAASEGENMLF